MNPDILNAVEKLPMDKRGELFTCVLQKINGQRPKVDEMLKPIFKRAFQKPRTDQREVGFREKVLNYKDTYSERLLKDFADYWTEGKIKMKFEKCKTFEIGKRLGTWAKNDKLWDKEEKTEFEDVNYGTF